MASGAANKIYALIDPRNDRVRFVGCCISIPKRVHLMMQRARGNKFDDPVTSWLRELLPLEPKVKYLGQPLEDPRLVLLDWIEKYKAEGEELLSEPKKRTPTGAYKVRWTPELKAQLGVVSDGRIAEQMGVTSRSVAEHRKRMGIPAADDRTRQLAATRRWQEEKKKAGG